VSVQVARTVGRYEIVREIGRGGMAVVYLARQTDLDRFVALKELAAFRAHDPDVVERFLRESRLAGSLSHPNIVTVHEYFEREGTAFIAMEYFERGSLRPLVGHLGTEQVGGVLEGLLAGLAHAERRGVVHRDLKPENVMVTAEGGVKIADFGIAKALEGPAARSLTGDGAAVGTPAYMAPELATGAPVGPWTDLYALGVMAYELLAGRLPFADTEIAFALMLRHANEPAPPLRSVRSDVDPALADWVDRLLEKAPADRPRGAAPAAEELDEILIALLGPRWRRQARLGSVDGARVVPARDGATPVRDGEVTPRLAAAPRRSLRRWLVTAAGAVGVALAAVTAVIVLGGRDEVAPPAKPVPDLFPAPAERLSAAGAGPSLFVTDPVGRVVKLAASKLDVSSTLRDPARPRDVVLARGALLMADDQGLTALDVDTLAPRAARALPGASLLAAAGGAVAAASTQGASRGRVCIVAGGLRLHPCASVRFAPSGLGVGPGGRVFVADGDGGTVTVLRNTGGVLHRDGGAVRVGRRPHGPIVLRHGALYVAVRRGIAVVDLSRGVTRTVALPVTPSDLWLASTGRLFAPLSGIDQVAVVDVRGSSTPRLVAAVRTPVTVSEAAGSVLVIGAGGAVARLDPRSGRLLGKQHLVALDGAPTRLLVLRRIGSTRAGETLTLTFRLEGGALDHTSLVVRDATIADGAASFQLWQGGIDARVRTSRADDLTAGVAVVSGRLEIALGAPTGSYERLRIEPAGRRAIRVTMRRTPPPATASGGGTSAGGSTGGGSTGGGTTQQPKPPVTPKKPTYDVG
jgi:predicted Ser/Thr protein kinase